MVINMAEKRRKTLHRDDQAFIAPGVTPPAVTIKDTFINSMYVDTVQRVMVDIDYDESYIPDEISQDIFDATSESKGITPKQMAKKVTDKYKENTIITLYGSLVTQGTLKDQFVSDIEGKLGALARDNSVQLRKPYYFTIYDDDRIYKLRGSYFFSNILVANMLEIFQNERVMKIRDLDVHDGINRVPADVIKQILEKYTPFFKIYTDIVAYNIIKTSYTVTHNYFSQQQFRSIKTKWLSCMEKFLVKYEKFVKTEEPDVQYTVHADAIP
jgi:hypothetical protein